ncbi:GNAT family N-acetyltransferase [Leekyejoonella antrihumi]|uniref:GNAT family N-acetyltransferase n=1 Tax=Leekyejoonella antrihumi TaxID=1660198 RepID=UPI00164836F4|nr:GNAT family N-acetyltransferase [Leekyejoonella antrihumi]
MIELDTVNARVAAELAAIHEESATAAYAHISDGPFPRGETRTRWATYTGRVALAQEGGRTIGFVAWHSDELDALYVRPEAAGTGVGTTLINTATNTTHLWVLEANAHARRFYEVRRWRASGAARRVWEGANEVEYRRG